jgi:hypothetical protein
MEDKITFEFLLKNHFRQTEPGFWLYKPTENYLGLKDYMHSHFRLQKSVSLPSFYIDIDDDKAYRTQSQILAKIKEVESTFTDLPA